MTQAIKVALVTGASGGIGQAISQKLAQMGYALVLNDLQASASLESLTAKLAEINCPYEVVLGDIAQLEFHQHLVDQALARFGYINALINNAGVSVLSRGDMLQASVESFDRCIHVNLRGTYFLTQAVAKAMLSHKPPADLGQSIVFITSSNAVAVSIDRSEYCASKAGLSMVAQSYAVRLANEGISVFELQPGLIETEMTQRSKPKYDALIEQGLLAENRWGQTPEIAQTVATLIEGGLPYTVGQVIRNDGGLNVKRF